MPPANRTGRPRKYCSEECGRAAAPTWASSVRKARGGARRAIEGRFTAALASYEQFDINGRGSKRERTLLDFAEEAGIPYTTLAEYRSIVAWWLEGDPELIDEIGVPDYIAWDGLRWGKVNVPLAAELRDALADVKPPPGKKVWLRDDLARLFRDRDVTIDVEPAPDYEPAAEWEAPAVAAAPAPAPSGAMRSLRTATSHVARALMVLVEGELDDDERGEALAELDDLERRLTLIRGYLTRGMDDEVSRFLAEHHSA